MSIEAKLQSSGLKLTEQRKTVAKVLADATDHPNVDELFVRCHEIDPKISISTVYRTVSQFEEAGIIEKHDFKEGKARYEIADHDDHHDHMVNVKTGEIIEFMNEEIERLQHKIAEDHGFELVDHRLELYVKPKT